MAECRLRVIKLGGSLLDLEDLAGRFRRWLAAQPPADNVLIVGGGLMADAIRQADRLHRLGEEASHWLCIRAMDVTGHLFGALLPEVSVVEWIEVAEPPQPGRLRILLPWRILSELDPQSDKHPLPHCWDVTSDSISAWIARLLGATELVLLKSTLPSGDNLDHASIDGTVDPQFRSASAGIQSIRCVNLRDEAFAERRF